jgi:hypothetical protein
MEGEEEELTQEQAEML